MASINIDDEKRLIVSIKDISSLDTSIGENQTVTADTSDINYIPGYVEAEKQRRENETERISNEAERKAYYQEIQEKVNNGEFKGEKGDKGEPGPKGDGGAPGEPGTTDYNELQNKPTIPSKTSDLVNDSDFVNGSDLSNKQDKLIAGTNITIENNVISSTGGSGTGGTTDYTELVNKPKINGVTLSGNKTLSELNIQEKGNYLEIESDPVYTADKPNIALKAELFSKNYNDLTNKPNIPTKVSDLTNDSGFIDSIPDEYITETELNKKGYLTKYTETDPIYMADKPNIALKTEIPNNDDFSLSGLSEKSYNNLTDKPTIPSKTSELTNDSSFLTETNFEEKITKKIINSLTGYTSGYFYYFKATNIAEVSENERIIVAIPFEENTENLNFFIKIGNYTSELYLKNGKPVRTGDFVSTCLCIIYYTSNDISYGGMTHHGGWIAEAIFNDMSDIVAYITNNFSLSSFTNDKKYVFYNNSVQTTINSNIKNTDATNKKIVLEGVTSENGIKVYNKIKIPKLNDYSNYWVYLDIGDDNLVPIYKYKSNPLYSHEVSEEITFSFDFDEVKNIIYMTYNLVDYIPTKTSDLTNDSNYVSDSDYVHTDNNYTTNEKTLFTQLLDDKVVEKNLNSGSGYIKYENGLMLQWKSQTVTAGGTSWGNVYYSDHPMGDWDIPFTSLFTTYSDIETLQHWCTNGNQTPTSAGVIRTFRPNAGTISTKITIFGLGLWKAGDQNS